MSEETQMIIIIKSWWSLLVNSVKLEEKRKKTNCIIFLQDYWILASIDISVFIQRYIEDVQILNIMLISLNIFKTYLII